jgi:hypothetical protein
MLDMSWPRSVKASMSLNKQWPVVVVCCSLSLFSPDSFPHQSKGTQKDSREFTFKSNASVVLVPVRVNDRQGNAVGGLKKEDFQVFDNNKRQNISGFMVATGAPPKTAANPQVPGGSYSAVGPRHLSSFCSTICTCLVLTWHERNKRQLKFSAHRWTPEIWLLWPPFPDL